MALGDVRSYSLYVNVALCGKMVFAGVIKAMDLKMRR